MWLTRDVPFRRLIPAVPWGKAPSEFFELVAHSFPFVSGRFPPLVTVGNLCSQLASTSYNRKIGETLHWEVIGESHRFVRIRVSA